MKSPTFDETQHLSSGYVMLKEKRLNLGIGHPPLFRLFIALPLLIVQPSYPVDDPLLSEEHSNDPMNHDFDLDYRFGYNFLYNSGNNPELIFFLGRSMCVVVGVLLGWCIYRCSRNLFGTDAALFTLLLYTFSPTILAHARLCVNDLAAASTIFLGLFFLVRYARHRSAINLLAVSAGLSLSVLVKFNSIILFPFVFIWLAYLDKERFYRSFAALAGMVWLFINLGYGFQGTFTLKAVDPDFFRQIIPFDFPAAVAFKSFQYIPLPTFFLNSVLQLFFHNLSGHVTFLNGMYSTTGWWYYFLLVFVYKTPLLTLLIFFAYVGILLKTRSISRHELIFTSFFLFYWVWSMSMNINIGHRHLLPIYPILFLLSGRVWNHCRRVFGNKAVVASLVGLYILSTQAYFPHYLPYFNCLIRPANGYKYLVDSNLDWGQDLPGLQKFMRNHGETALILSYFGMASESHYGIQHQSLLKTATAKQDNPRINEPDVNREFLAVSATNLQGVYYGNFNGVYSWLKSKKPIQKIGYSIFVYDISDDQEASAIIGEIYRLQGKMRWALRQYRRVLQISSDGMYADWARQKIQEVDVGEELH